MASNIISAYYSFQDANQPPEEIDGSIMTHLIVGWAVVVPETGACQADVKDYVTQFRRCTQLRKPFPHLTVSLVCGGGATTFSVMANSPTKRQIFISTAIAVLEECGFDGIDLDWEFPVFQGFKHDRRNFVQLLREMRVAFDTHSPKYLLTIAGAAQKLVAAPAYDIPGIAPLVDFVNLMCYDYNMFKCYNVFASYNAPLFRRPGQKAIFGTMNTVWSADYWVAQGMPKEKVIVGIPTYARSWKLLCPCWHSYNALCVSEFASGMCTYPDVCQVIADGGQRVFDRHARVPYVYKDRKWISYEDVESVTQKAEWIRENGFGGAMIFSVNHDDWKGAVSGAGKRFPLMAVVHRILSAAPAGQDAGLADADKTTEETEKFL